MFVRTFKQLAAFRSVATFATASLRRSFCVAASSDTSVHELSEQEISRIANNDPEMEKKIKLIVMEMNVFKYENYNVPKLSSIEQHDWEQLCSKRSRNARLSYYSYLFKTEKSIENDKRRQKENAVVREKRRIETNHEIAKCKEEGRLFYGLSGNSIFTRIYENKMMHFYNQKLVEAMVHGQKMIVDCGFDDSMSFREARSCAKQLMLLFAENRMHTHPFDLHFCNVNRNRDVMKELNKFIRPLFEDWFPLHLHATNYSDVFPNANFVYLTPHCNRSLDRFDHDAVYIVGGIVDKSNNEPLTLAKAKNEGIRMAKLPLDEHLVWGTGATKNLTVEQVIRIMLDVKKTNDWPFALRHVPKRKLFVNQQVPLSEEELRKREEFKRRRKLPFMQNNSGW